METNTTFSSGGHKTSHQYTPNNVKKDTHQSLTEGMETSIMPVSQEQEPGVESHEKVIDFEEKLRERNKRFADQTLLIAKERGIDGAFEFLAEEDEESHDEKKIDSKKTIVRQEEESQRFRELAEKRMKRDSRESQKTILDPEQEEVQFLKEQIEELKNSNPELRDQVENLQAEKEITLEALLTMAQMMKKVIEEKEEDEEKKNNLLSILIGLIGTVMQMIADPEKTSREIERKMQEQDEKQQAA